MSSGLRPRDARWLAGGFLLFLASSFGQTFFVSLFAADLRVEHGLSHGAFGGLYTAATLVSALALTATGHVVDRRSARAVALWAVAALAAGAAVMAAASHVAALLVAVLLLRFFGQGMLTHLSFTLMGRWFTAERGRAVSTATLGLNTGEALLPVVVVGLVAVVGWRGAWWLAAGALVVVAAVLAGLFAQERTPAAVTAAPSRPPVPSRTRAEALRDPYFHLVVLAVAAPALIGNTVFFHQVHLVELRGWSLTAQASAFSVYAVTTVAFNLVGGRLVDRVSALAILPFFLLPLAGGLLVLAGVDAQWAVFGFMALYGVTNGLSLSMFGATWPEIYGVDHLGAIRSVVVAVLVFASAAGPGLCGLLIDAGVALPLQIAVLGGYCLAASALMLVVTRRLRARLSA